MTKDQAVRLANSRFWENLTFRERALFQLFEERLCMPFPVFQEAVEKSIGRPVFTHEFALNVEGLQKELLGESNPPTLQEIINLIPAEKRILL